MGEPASAIVLPPLKPLKEYQLALPCQITVLGENCQSLFGDSDFCPPSVSQLGPTPSRRVAVPHISECSVQVEIGLPKRRRNPKAMPRTPERYLLHGFDPMAGSPFSRDAILDTQASAKGLYEATLQRGR